jgi:hypothetical protein
MAEWLAGLAQDSGQHQVDRFTSGQQARPVRAGKTFKEVVLDCRQAALRWMAARHGGN